MAYKNTLICRNCGWLNESDGKVCVKCHALLSRIDISEVNGLPPVVARNNQYKRFYREWQRYTVWGLYKIKLYKIREEDYHRFKITRIIINTPLERSVLKIIERLQNLKYDRYYLCPICGESLTEIEFPMVTGDDHVCRCPVCRNEFVFGGTYPNNFKFTPLDFFSPSPNKLAYNAILTRIESREKEEGEIIYQHQNIFLFMIKSRYSFQVTTVLELCK